MIFDLLDEDAAEKKTESASDSLLFTLSHELQDNPSEVVELKLDQVIPDPDQPRQTFDEDSLLDLAQSIQENGLLQPIVVQPTDKAEQYKIVIGERRWRAHQFTDKDFIPALIRSPNDVDILALQIIENNQREDVAPRVLVDLLLLIVFSFCNNFVCLVAISTGDHASSGKRL